MVMIAYVIEAANTDKVVICILSDNTDMYVWISRLQCVLVESGVQLVDGAVEWDCDTISHPYAKDFFGLADLLREVDTTIVDPMEAAKAFIALCGQRPGTLHSVHEEDETPSNIGPASNIFHPVRSCVEGSSVGDAVESGRSTSPTR